MVIICFLHHTSCYDVQNRACISFYPSTLYFGLLVFKTDSNCSTDWLTPRESMTFIKMDGAIILTLDFSGCFHVTRLVQSRWVTFRIQWKMHLFSQALSLAVWRSGWYWGSDGLWTVWYEDWKGGLCALQSCCIADILLCREPRAGTDFLEGACF